MSFTEYPVQIEGQTTTVSSAEELVTVLDVLHGQHDRAVLQQLAPHLSRIIDGPRGLHAVLRVLEPADQCYLIGCLGPQLTDTVQRATALRDILAMLSEQRVEEALLRGLGSVGLRRLIRSSEQLTEVLEWTYGQCDVLALDLLGDDFLRGLVDSGYELSLVLNGMDRTCQRRLVEMLGWDYTLGLLHNEQDLAYLMRALPATLSRELLERLPDENLRQIVRDERDWESIAPSLDADEMSRLRQRLETPDAQ